MTRSTSWAITIAVFFTSLIFLPSCVPDQPCRGISYSDRTWDGYQNGDTVTFQAAIGGAEMQFVNTDGSRSCYVIENCTEDCICENWIDNTLNSADTNFTINIRFLEYDDPNDDFSPEPEISLIVGDFYSSFRPWDLTMNNTGLSTVHDQLTIGSIVYDHVHEFQFDTTTSVRDVWHYYATKGDGIIQFSSRSSGDWNVKP